MEEGEAVDFKTLRAKFQSDPRLKIQIKPVIPEKPKTLTSPTTKISNPLIASMNSGRENRMAPRVVFRDDKKSSVKRQISQEPLVQQELLDKNQKKEGDLVKQALKDKKLPLVLPVNPVTPVIVSTPEPEPTPVLASPVKVSTPKKKTIFSFKKSVKGNKENVESAESAPSASPAPASPALSSTTAVSAGHEVLETIASKAMVPPVQMDTIPASSTLNPNVSTPAISSPIVPESDISAQTPPQPDIVPKTSPTPKISPSEIPITLNPSITLPEPDVYSYSMPEEVTSPQEIPDILGLDIHPPIIPEDIPVAHISVVAVSPPVTSDPPILPVDNYTIPVSNSPGLSPTASPVTPSPTQVTHEPSGTLLLATIDPENATRSSPSPTSEMTPSATEAELTVENQAAGSQSIVQPTEKPLEVLSSTAPKAISALSALARAEEMVHIRQNHCDQRVLNLLERAKRKYAPSNQVSTPTTPEITTPEETALAAIAPPEISPPEIVQPPAIIEEAIQPVETSPAPEVPDVTLPDVPPTEDHAGQVASVASESQPLKPADLDPRHTSPVPKVSKVLVVQSHGKAKSGPPPPPPRRTPEKPPRVQSTFEPTTFLPAQPVNENGIIIPAPANFASDDSTINDLEIENSADPMVCEVPIPEALAFSNSPSVHEQAFLEQLRTDHQSPMEHVPNEDESKSDFEIPQAVGLADTVDIAVNHTVPSPTGTLETNSSSDVYEDLGANKKGKTLKKQRKGSPLNPYADESVLAEEAHKKSLFSKKNASPEEKELKKKEKQKGKEKEKEREKKEQKEKEREKKDPKEKEREKKEQKEKEREKKEQKDKEKEKELKEKENEKKELKEKEKDKKEQKEKEKEKKDPKEKEKEKKELKEREREKKEQKEKEKKESEMKKKFKITGEEEVIYQAKVIETCKGRKNDLAVKAGEMVNIIRTSDCPKGKWLARDSTNKYGYVPVESVELSIQEVLEMGKRAAASRPNSTCFPDGDVASMGSRTSNHYIHENHESFTDDSEEWCDDEDTPFTPTDTTDLDFNPHLTHSETVSPEPDPAQQDQTHANENVHARQEALRKLATFFTQNNTPDHAALKNSTIIEEPEPEEPLSLDKQEMDLQILPPPDLYADIIVDNGGTNSN